MAKSCNVLEKVAKRAFDKAMGVWYEMWSIYEEYAEATKKNPSCWSDLYYDMRHAGAGMKFEEFEKRAKECADLDEQEERFRKKWEDAMSRVDKANDVWDKAEDKWKDCIHKEKKVKMRLPE